MTLLFIISSIKYKKIINIMNNESWFEIGFIAGIIFMLAMKCLFKIQGII